MTWNFHDNPHHIFYRDYFIYLSIEVNLKRRQREVTHHVIFEGGFRLEKIVRNVEPLGPKSPAAVTPPA